MTLASGSVPGISHHQMLLFMLQIGLLIAVAAGLGRVAVRLRLPPVVGELTAGVVLGPSLFGNIAPGVSHWLLPRDPEQMHLLSAVAQLGVLLLVAITGAHIDLALLGRKRRAIGLVSMGSVLLPLALGFALGFLLPGSLMGGTGGRTTFALFIGVAVAVSALPVIAKTLFDMGLLHRNVGQIIVGSAAVSDIVGCRSCRRWRRTVCERVWWSSPSAICSLCWRSRSSPVRSPSGCCAAPSGPASPVPASPSSSY
jgi:Kef-type K+ transport system membrane component KefB